MARVLLHSIQSISNQYDTGDAPVLVLCSDKERYICKFMRPSATIAYKLACEFIGATLAEAWHISTPPFAIVNILPEHWTTISAPHSLAAPAIGFRKLNNVIDITPTTFKQVEPTPDTLYQLLKIALFDFWVANEDRTYNNANLLYDVVSRQLVSIDYGGIFNNVSFDYPLAQLTETDSILCADIFTHIAKSTSSHQLNSAVAMLQKDFAKCALRCRNLPLLDLPLEWNIPQQKVETKLQELYHPSWIDATWDNFIECLKSNSTYGE